MDLEHLKNGDFLKIKNKDYEVLYSQEEADIIKPPYKEIRTFTAVYLHEIESKSLFPTHDLWYYPDTKEVFFSSLQREKVSQRQKLDLKDIELSQQ